MDPATYTPNNLAAEARAKFEGFAHSAVAAPQGSRDWQPPGTTTDDAKAVSPCRTAQDKSFYDNAVGSRRQVKNASSSNAEKAAAEWDRTHPRNAPVPRRVLPPSTAATRPRPQQPRNTAPLLRPHRLSSMPWVAEHTHPDDDEVMLPGVPPFPTDDFRGWLLSIGAGEEEAGEFVEEMQQFASQSLGGCSPAVLVSDDFEFQKTDSAQGMVSGTAVVLRVKLLWVEGRSYCVCVCTVCV